MILLDAQEIAVRQCITRSFVERGIAPTSEEMAHAGSVSLQEVEPLLRSLADKKALVLQPHRPQIWIAHPFSAAPAGVWVETLDGKRGWWSPCAWCALGVAALVRQDVRLVTFLGRGGGPLDLRVIDGKPQAPPLVVHFPVPVPRLWDSVLYACSVMLFHRSEAAVTAWCDRHAIAKGAVVALPQAWDLARRWYGPYLDADWNRKSGDEVKKLFSEVGLGMDFQPLHER